MNNIELDRLIRVRRHLHENPELSFQEFETSAYICGLLRSYGLEVHEGIGRTGIVAVLHGGKPGPVLALRADMDALPIQDAKQTVYRSKKAGVMHACGHDGHVSILLETARLLSERQASLQGTVKFVFQHAEELVPGGAKTIIESGYLDDVGHIFGLHLWSGIESGKIGIRPGPVMASSDHFDIRLTGRGGHGAMPHESVDLIYLSANLISQLQGVVSRRINPVKPCLISIGSIHGGSTYNVLPGEVRLQGTVRAFDALSRSEAQRLIDETVSSLCALYGAEHQFDYHHGYPAVVNHPGDTGRLRQTLERFFPVDTVFEMQPLMVGEDFSFYLEKIPGCFFFVGSAAGADSRFPHHHERFDLDESAMMTGVQTFLTIVEEWLGKSAEDGGVA